MKRVQKQVEMCKRQSITYKQELVQYVQHFFFHFLLYDNLFAIL